MKAQGIQLNGIGMQFQKGIINVDIIGPKKK